MFFNKNVKYLCLKNNTSQTVLATLLNTSKQSLNSILNKNNPTARIIINISKVFNVSIDDLLLKDLSSFEE
ncbi:MAG: helix-turn-helix transcriptional regulator [Acholeplasmatales bacterium]|nr:helix-turn-helix transcriptional regulator [Acholeplasmatales bacterium]